LKYSFFFYTLHAIAITITLFFNNVIVFLILVHRVLKIRLIYIHVERLTTSCIFISFSYHEQMNISKAMKFIQRLIEAALITSNNFIPEFNKRLLKPIQIVWIISQIIKLNKMCCSMHIKCINKSIYLLFSLIENYIRFQCN
jgi:hypothetical protein